MFCKLVVISKSVISLFGRNFHKNHFLSIPFTINSLSWSMEWNQYFRKCTVITIIPANTIFFKSFFFLLKFVRKFQELQQHFWNCYFSPTCAYAYFENNMSISVKIYLKPLFSLLHCKKSFWQDLFAEYRLNPFEPLDDDWFFSGRQNKWFFPQFHNKTRLSS